LSTTSSAETLPTSSGNSIGRRSSSASFKRLMAARVNLVFFLTMTSLPILMSRVARWPASKSYSMLFENLPPFST
jgi:hypothetical protein